MRNKNYLKSYNRKDVQELSEQRLGDMRTRATILSQKLPHGERAWDKYPRFHLSAELMRCSIVKVEFRRVSAAARIWVCP